MRGSLVGCALALLLGLAGPAIAHHSAAGIDRTKTVTLVGTINKFSWSSPHSWMEVLVPNDKGGTDTWAVEMTSPTYLARAGWKSSSVKAGDKVSVVLRPLRSGDPGGLFVSVTLANGQTLSERPVGPAPPAANP